ncbi:SDR family oxidoreductase [Lacisediminihabitans profunda]|uniref:NAD(P)H-binding protein n=1 Tax=Lacisediminihabitans profunda TaxID=2594790 RepID=A0A5C8UMQ0_9MICO|nr:NAD(P)H-binding protein [Lacisediminihabitans profunda]TXN29148.1 NAD(P)H-binding protein [Lacisediminihabitans profunda]
MKIAITGGAGFVGRHLAERFDAADIVTVSRRTGVDLEDVEALTEAFARCEVVAHCAGINREIGQQTYQKVHIDGTRTVIEAARRAGVTRIVMLSFLRARPDCGSPYHESKWAAEELLRNSGLDYTILKAGMIYGHGDHLVDHVSHSVQTIPLFATVGFHEKPIRPIPVSEMVDVLVASIEGKLPKSTVAVTGGEELMLSEVVHRVARVVGRRVAVVPSPVWFIRIVAQLTEWTMKVPLIAKAQARMLAEGVSEAAPPTPDLPAELRPKLPFSVDQIEAALPPRGGFGVSDLRLAR